MNILVLGGTGAMGASLVPMLAADGNEVTVTSRSAHKSYSEGIHYLKGNAHEMPFMREILKEHYDAVVDFMSYTTKEFQERYKLFLNSTDHYIFLSSSRVYADSKSPITEESPRLLDVSTDKAYLKTDEYALEKARQENMLLDSGKQNWTIVRPYITYGNERLQLGIYEKELWLYRVLHGQTIIFPKDMAECTTTLTWGEDVARGITAIVGNTKAYEQTAHITTSETIRWCEVMELYQRVFLDVTGRHMKVKLIDSSVQLRRDLFNQYQIRYDRLFDRKFDNSKILRLAGENICFVSPKNGLEKCLREFLVNPCFRELPSMKMRAWLDRRTNENTPLKDLPGWEKRFKYVIGRYTPYFIIKKP